MGEVSEENRENRVCVRGTTQTTGKEERRAILAGVEAAIDRAYARGTREAIKAKGGNEEAKKDGRTEAYSRDSRVRRSEAKKQGVRQPHSSGPKWKKNRRLTW